MKAFATFICYNKPSLFLEHEEEYVKKLFTMSRSILNTNFNTTEIKPKFWIKTRKKKTYNKTFLQLPEKEEETIKFLCETDDYDIEIVQYFTELKTMVSHIVF